MAEKMQTDDVLSRQAVFVRYCLKKVRLFSFDHSAESSSCLELVVPQTLTLAAASLVIPMFLATLS